MTPREEVERSFGRYENNNRRTPPSWAPSHWTKTLKALVYWMLIVVLIGMLAGMTFGVLT